MKRIITQWHLKPINMILALAIVWTGFAFDLYGDAWLHSKGTGILHILNWAIVTTSAILGLGILIGKDGLKLAFSWSKLSFTQTILLGIGIIIISFVVAVAMAGLETYVFNFKIHPNDAGKQNYLQLMLTLPGYMLFEEVWTAVMLIIVARYAFKATRDYAKSFWIASIIVAVIFGLGHFTTYFNGNLWQTIIHVLIVQGIARIIFNISTFKTDTILLPFIIHWIYDVLTFTIGKH